MKKNQKTTNEPIKKKYEALKKQHQLLLQNMQCAYSINELIFDNSGKPVDFKIIEANEQFKKLTNKNDVTGKNAFEVFQNISDEQLNLFAQVVKGQTINKKEHYCNTLKKWLYITTYHLYDNYFVYVFNDMTKEKKAIQNLEEERNYNQKIIEISPVGITFVNKDGKITYANNEAQKILSLTKDEITNRTYNAPDWQIIDLNKKPFPEEKLPFVQVKKQKKAIFNIKHGIKKADNSILYLSINALPLFDKKQEFDGMIAAINDITQTIISQQAIAKNEQKYRLLFENMMNGFAVHKVIYDTKNKPIDYIVIDINPAYEKLTGLTKEKILNKRIKEALPHIEDQWIEKTGQVALTGEPTIIENYTQSLDKYFLIYVFSPKKGQFAIIFEDITERKKAEQKLLEKQKELEKQNKEYQTLNQEYAIANQKLLEKNTAIKKINLQLKENDEQFKTYIIKAPVTIFILSFNGKITFANPAACQILGYTETELISKYYYELPPKKELENALTEFKKTQNKQEIKNFQTKFQKKNGEIIDVIIDSIFLDSDRIMTFCKNISEIKSYEKKLIKAKEKAEQADRLKSAFIANMSHEIRTPMNGIIGFSELLKTPEINQEKQQYYIEVINESSQQLLKIVNDILEIAKIEAGHAIINEIEVCINSIMLSIFSFFKIQANKSNLNFYLKNALTDDESYIKTDQNKLKQILNNLLSNALKFTSEGYIELGYQLKSETSELEFYVKDTGIGISKEQKEAIFERFRQLEDYETRKYGGTGLGLSISKELVKLLGGKIYLESEPNQGSTFFFTIPYNPTKIVLKQAIENNKIKPTILVAEDEEVNYLYIAEVLEHLGYNVLHAKNGQEAIEIFQENETIKLIFMDLKMPVLDGYEATLHIKQQLVSPPIVAFTAYAMSNDITEAQKYGFDDYITKPVIKETIINILKKYIKTENDH